MNTNHNDGRRTRSLELAEEFSLGLEHPVKPLEMFTYPVLSGESRAKYQVVAVGLKAHA